MDPETRKAIDAVRADLRAVEARLRSELRSEMSMLESKLRPEIRDEGAATRGHIDVVSERVRDNLKLIAERLIRE